jgi:hypothetical protein
MIDADVLENTPRAYIGKVQGNPYGWWRHFRWKGPTRAVITQPRDPSSGSRDLRSLRVTFHDVTSGQKVPLGRILRNFRLRMRTLKGKPFAVTSHPVDMVLVLLYYILYYFYSKKKKRGETVAHTHAITSGSGQGRFRARDWRHFRAGDFRSRDFR